MTFKPEIAVLRLQREVPEAERKIDEAIVATTSILQTIMSARSVVDVPAASVQHTVARIVKAQNALIEASREVLRAHGDLGRYQVEYMGADEPTCPSQTGLLEDNPLDEDLAA